VSEQKEMPCRKAKACEQMIIWNVVESEMVAEEKYTDS